MNNDKVTVNIKFELPPPPEGYEVWHKTKLSGYLKQYRGAALPWRDENGCYWRYVRIQDDA